MESIIEEKGKVNKKLKYPPYLQIYSDIDGNILNSTLKKELRGSIERHKVKSKELNNERDIDVYLPPTYKKNLEKHYPVLYMHDGNNLFYPELSFAGIPWKVDQTIEKLFVKHLLEEFIVVGIHNTNLRSYEYTWTEMDWKDKKEGGGGEKYARFIIENVKTLVDSKYRTKKDRNHTAVMGSSLGGLISLYLGIKHPETFSKIGVVSPSLWWGYGQSFKDIVDISTDLKIWLDMGIKEGMYKSSHAFLRNIHIDNIRHLKEELIKKGYKEGLTLGYYEDQDGLHNELSWGNRLSLPLLFFFGRLN